MDIVSQFIQNDFPLFTQVNGPQLVAFIAAYYEWMEQQGNVRDYINHLRDYRDIDNTLQEFITHFQYEYLNNLPANLIVNKPLLVKHILDLYRAKGTRRGIALLFRILFNEDVEIYLPGNDVFRASAAQWVQPSYIELSDCPFLNNLVGCSIYSLNGGATAIVESFNIVRTSNKVINILYLSNVNGAFLYGDTILSNDYHYDLSFAPRIVGSLSSVTIENGGTFFNVGDIVSIEGSGSGALGRVASTTSENGKVTFTLNKGGFGFTTGAQIQVINTQGGAGASFTVGSLVNQQNYLLNNDIISNYIGTALDNPAAGFKLTMTHTGTPIFLAAETVNIVFPTNCVDLDFSYISGTTLQIGESLANSSVLTTGVTINLLDNPSFVRVSAPDATLAQLQGGQVLHSTITNCVVAINSVMPKTSYNTTAVIQATNGTTSANVDSGGDGYPMPGSTVTGVTSGSTGTITSVIRNTNWAFPVTANTNLDSTIGFCLTWQNMVIGTIASLAQENPGNFYPSSPTVTITQPNIAALCIDDGQGGIWGADANVTANAIFANGIATSIQIIESGFGFGKGETLELSKEGNPESIQAFAITEGTGIGQGYWLSNPSGVSDTSHLLDSYYYQDYSYELVAARALDSYQTLVEGLMGPIGYVMFGQFSISDNQNINSTIQYDTMTQLST